MHNAGHEGEGQKRQGYQLPDHRHRGALPDRPVLIPLRDAGWMAVQCFQAGGVCMEEDARGDDALHARIDCILACSTVFNRFRGLVR